MTAWLPILTAATAISVPVLTAVGAVALKRVSNRTENANAHKAEVEAHSTEVDIARNLLDDVRAMYSEQRKSNIEDRVEYEGQLAAMREKLANVEAGQAQTDHRLTVLLASLAAHQPWDEAAYAALTEVHPHYPAPPPLDTHMDGRDNNRR